MPRFHVELRLAEGECLELPEGAARHVQVLRLQPGSPLTLFDGRGGEWAAVVERMGRREVQVRVGAHDPVERELPVAVTIAVGVPANERMDALVEKATELGVAAIQPLVCERSVLRLAGERAERRRAHWAAIAAAASEQCGRTRVPVVAPLLGLLPWLATLGGAGSRAAGASGTPLAQGVKVVQDGQGAHGEARWVLSPAAVPALPWGPGVAAGPASMLVLSGPEGGFSAEEIAAALARGFAPLGLGPRVLRADTAPLALLAWVGGLTQMEAVSRLAPPGSVHQNPPP